MSHVANVLSGHDDKSIELGLKSCLVAVMKWIVEELRTMRGCLYTVWPRIHMAGHESVELNSVNEVTSSKSANVTASRVRRRARTHDDIDTSVPPFLAENEQFPP